THTCVLAADRKAYCWGDGAVGQLGNGTYDSETTPVAVSRGEMPLGATIQQIAAGYRHTCVIASDNKAYCWGQGTKGRLGNGGTSDQNTPVAVSQGVMPAGVTIKQITAGYDFTCALA